MVLLKTILSKPLALATGILMINYLLAYIKNGGLNKNHAKRNYPDIECET
jgi:hypothetical protein